MNHDIKIIRVGQTVKVQIPTDLPCDDAKECYIEFTHNCSSAFNAEMLVRYLRERHGEAIQEIREREFSSGWKQGRAKKHGKKFFNWFDRTMNRVATWGHIT